MIKVRFAPSPTGFIHIGNCRTLLINWLFTRSKGGKFLLRIDDTDQERSEKRFEDALYEDMEWLGLNFDELERQTNRLDRYKEVAEQLKAMGRLYPCYETQEELEFKRRLQLAKKLPPLYDRESLHLKPYQIQKFQDEGRIPHYRFLLDDQTVEWDDMIRGPIHFEGTKLSDPVLIREDGMPIYTFASVVDDMDMNITHIIRGEDHIGNTAIQIQLWRALGMKDGTFSFAHLSLLSKADGTELSKRLGSDSVRDLRKSGILPMAINSMLAKIGSSDSIKPYQTMAELLDTFDIEKFSKATPKFSVDDLKTINQKILHHLTLDQIKSLGEFSYLNKDFWSAIQGNIEQLDDIEKFWHICHNAIDPVTLSEEDVAFIQCALDTLPDGPWTENPWDQWIRELQAQSNRKGKALYMPLRQALTGQNHGPELKLFMGLMGFDKVQSRLKNALTPQS